MLTLSRFTKTPEPPERGNRRGTSVGLTDTPRPHPKIGSGHVPGGLHKVKIRCGGCCQPVWMEMRQVDVPQVTTWKYP